MKELLDSLTPVYVCAHTPQGLVSLERCDQGCNGQMAHYRRDDLLKASKASPHGNPKGGPAPPLPHAAARDTNQEEDTTP